MVLILSVDTPIFSGFSQISFNLCEFSRIHLHLHLFVQEKQDIHFSKTLTVEPDTQGTSVH